MFILQNEKENIININYIFIKQTTAKYDIDKIEIDLKNSVNV